MGDRTSVQFTQLPMRKDGEAERSIVICAHWGGEEFPKLAQEFVRTRGEPQDELSKMGVSTPQTRRDIPYFTVEFIQWLSGRMEVYVGVDLNHVDNSDNGNYVIDVHTGEVVAHEVWCWICGEREVDEKTMVKVIHPSWNISIKACPECVALDPEERKSLYFSEHLWMVPEEK
jgi:hypothetical protein